MPMIYLIGTLIFLFTVLSVIFIRLYGENLYNLYKQRVIYRAEEGLKQSFVETSAKKLLLRTLVITVILTVFLFFILNLIGILIGILVGLSAPLIQQYLTKKKRNKLFIYQLPDTLSAIASSMKAGANLNKSLEIAAQRQPLPTSQEFGIIVRATQAGQELESALKELETRIPCQELSLMTSAITTSKKVGGNLADTLETLSETLREKAQIEGKIEALTASGKAQGWVVSLLPVGVGVALYFQQPDSMMKLFNTLWGNLTLLVIVVMMTTAVYFIRKIVNIDV